VLEIRDIANLLVAGAGAVLAWIAIRLARRQEEISKRQASIAEKQDQIMQQQLAKMVDCGYESPNKREMIRNPQRLLSIFRLPTEARKLPMALRGSSSMTLIFQRP
jgi:hypothetical protein